MNARLHEWVTSGLFQMTLTKRQIAFLTAVYANDRDIAEVSGSGNRRRPSRWVSTYHELYERGLLTHIRDLVESDIGLAKLAQAEGISHSGNWVMKQPFNRIYILTKAGKLMCELLKEAGLIDPELPEAKPFTNPTKPRIRVRAQKETS